MKFSAITATYLCLASFATMSQAANLRKSRAATIAEEESRNLSVIAAGGRITLPEEDRKLFTRNEQDQDDANSFIISFEQRVLETYERLGLYTSGDDYEFDYSNLQVIPSGWKSEMTRNQIGHTVDLQTFEYENDSTSPGIFRLLTRESYDREVRAEVGQGFIFGPNGGQDIMENHFGQNFQFSLSLPGTTMRYRQNVEAESFISVPAMTRVEGVVRAVTRYQEFDFERTLKIFAHPDKGVKLTIKDRQTGMTSHYVMSLHDSVRVEAGDEYFTDGSYYSVDFKCFGSFKAVVPGNDGNVIVDVRHYDLTTNELVKVESLTIDEEGTILDQKELPIPVQIV